MRVFSQGKEEDERWEHEQCVGVHRGVCGDRKSAARALEARAAIHLFLPNNMCTATVACMCVCVCVVCGPVCVALCVYLHTRTTLPAIL